MGKPKRPEPSPQTEGETSFMEPLPEDLQCAICLGAAIVAHVTEECGHLYCRDCIMGALDNKKECPYCRGPLTVEGIRKDVRAQRRIQSLAVHCTHHKKGCKWTGEFRELETHTASCPHAPVSCPFSLHGCDASVCRKELPKHMSACPVTKRLAKGEVALQRVFERYRKLESSTFVWTIESFERKELSSRVFAARGLCWLLKVSDQSDSKWGVYLYDAVDHGERPNFKLTLFNADEKKNKVLMAHGWNGGTSWGYKDFIPEGDLYGLGFLVNGCLRIGVDVDEPSH